MRRLFIFRFPPNRRAERATMAGQLMKLMEETREVLQAYDGKEGSARVIEELWDVVQAAEGALRKFPITDVLKGLALVIIKSRRRGDY